MKTINMIMVAALVALGSQATIAAEKKTVAYIAPSLDIDYWQWVGYGVKKKAEELGQGIDAAEQVFKALNGEKTTQNLALVMPLVTADEIDGERAKKVIARIFPQD